MQNINYNKHFIDKKDINAIISCFKSENITQGKLVEKFERNLSNKFKSRFCIALSSGTAALHLSLLSLGIKKNDIICSSPITFLSAANMVKTCGGKNIFIDIDKKTNNINVSKLEKFLRKKKKVKAVIATDYGGLPCDWKRLKFLSKKYKFFLINDNCHAIGSKYYGDIGYAVKYADLVTHSYHAVKNITTGEGGSVLTNNKNLFKKIKILRNHGLEKISKNIENPNWPYRLNFLGFNYRITDFQCALGSSQLKKLSIFIKRRREIANIYYKKLDKFDCIELPQKNKNIFNSFHLFPIKIHFNRIRINKKAFILNLKKQGINLQVHYFPVHKHRIHKKNYSKLLNAEMFYKNSVSLPIYFSLKNKQVDKICSSLKRFIIKK